MTLKPSSLVYWLSDEQKKKIEKQIKKDFHSVSEGIRSIILLYFAAKAREDKNE